jgi:hypothetical protein
LQVIFVELNHKEVAWNLIKARLGTGSCSHYYYVACCMLHVGRGITFSLFHSSIYLSILNKTSRFKVDLSDCVYEVNVGTFLKKFK